MSITTEPEYEQLYDKGKSFLDNVNNQILLMFCVLATIIFLVYRQYKSELTPKSYVTTIYLYVAFALIFASIIGKYAAQLSITDRENMWKMVLAYFFLIFSGISLIMNDNFFVNHIGLLLLLIGIGLVLGSSFKRSNNILNAAIMTGLIVIILTFIVFRSSTETLIKMRDWLPGLLMCLICFIFIQILILLFYGGHPILYTIMGATGVLLFSSFVLSDTSRLLLEARSLPCNTHSCINYPSKSTSLMLDYINIFMNMLNVN